jgi:hypothetical protein
MAGSDRERIAQTTRTVANWLAESSEHCELLRTTNDAGERPIIVALEDELFSTVLHRISWTDGPYANLFVRMNDDSILAGSMMPAASALDESAKHEFDSEFHRDVRMGEIVRAAETLANAVSIRITIGDTSSEVAPMRDLASAK